MNLSEMYKLSYPDIIFIYFIGTSEIIEDNLRSSRLKSYKDPPKKRNRNMN